MRSNTNQLKKRLLAVALAVVTIATMNAQNGLNDNDIAVANLKRGIELSDNIFNKMFRKQTGRLSFYYDIATKSQKDVVSVWEYTAAFETVNSVLEGLEEVKEAEPELYAETHDRYVQLLSDLYSGLGYYQGAYTESAPLISYTGPNAWSPVYGVHRASVKGNANVQGIENVYDDQMWIIREMVRAYNNTGDVQYLQTAEALTAYVLDGWDCNLKANGEEYGGITWGPGYTSKHSCSNGPLISPLVWLSEIYSTADNAEKEVTYYVLDKAGKREQVTRKKSEYYLDFAKKIFDWQYNTLRDASTGVFWDATWASTGTIEYREIDGVKYRVHLDVGAPGGDKWTYNTGVMVSGAADIYRVTSEQDYLTKLQDLGDKAYKAFSARTRISGKSYYQLRLNKNSSKGCNGSPWFNQVLERAFIAETPFVSAANSYVEEEQKCLDYAYENFLKEGFLPVNLLAGWEGESEVNVQYALSRASEYALIVKYTPSETAIKATETVKKNNDKVDVYTLDGRKVKSHVGRRQVKEGLPKGIYIVDGEKYTVQ